MLGENSLKLCAGFCEGAILVVAETGTAWPKPFLAAAKVPVTSDDMIGAGQSDQPSNGRHPHEARTPQLVDPKLLRV